MPMPEYFVLNDESKSNSHGFRMLNAGAILTRFNDNPTMLFSHKREDVIGRWEDLQIEGSIMRAKPVFDDQDKGIGERIAGKVERGFIKGASLGIYIQDAQYMDTADGKGELVVTKYEVIEASVLSIPSNDGALAFYAADGVQLTADEVLSTVQNLAAPTKPKEFINPKKNMEKITLSAEAATALGIAVEHADMSAINVAITALASRATAAETKLTGFNKERATSLVDLAIADGRLEATRKDSFVALAISDFKNASDILGALPVKKELGAGVKAGEKGVHTDRADWDYMRWAKEDSKGLEQLQATQPAEFERLRNEYKPKFS